ncbi:MAG TPA: flagellar basal body P-ring formation protein FlgA [Candidatus Latescibacteria bacterium]|nr:flagellar basal body P-ring formation protein FlgA [Candidatus Latescibacterota bacterium]
MAVVIGILLWLSAWGSDLGRALEELFEEANPEDEVRVRVFSRLPSIPEFRILLPETRARGDLVVYVEELKEGYPVRTFPVRVSVRTFGPVAILKHRVDRHHIISEEDVKVVRRETTFLPRDIVRSPKEAIGLRTKGIIGAGSLLRKGLLEEPPVVHRGDRVTIRVVLPGILAEAEGEAKVDGRIGEIISVRNVRSGKVVMGRVVDGHTVVVVAP